MSEQQMSVMNPAEQHLAGFIPIQESVRWAGRLRTDMRWLGGWSFEIGGQSFERARQLQQTSLSGVDSLISMFWSLMKMWADNAFPCVQVGHKYAAALMSSSVSKSVEVRPPWDGFVLHVPRGMLFLTGTDGKQADVYRVFVGVRDGEWSYIGMSEGAFIHRWRASIDVLDRRCEDDLNFQGSVFHPMDDIDGRCQALIGRLVIAVCLAMSDPDAVKPIGKGHSSGENRRDGDEPTAKTFQLGRPINVDCRQAVADYMAGESGRIHSVQWLVRGHWRNQACGHGLLERRPTWIEPYWKGPEDAPINMRPHVLDKGAA